MSCKHERECGYDHCDWQECVKYEERTQKAERAKILDAAERCVCGERDVAYGAPEDNFRTIASVWSWYLDLDLDALDVGMMMALLKIARVSSGSYSADNFVDLAGYAACSGEIAKKIDGGKG